MNLMLLPLEADGKLSQAQQQALALAAQNLKDMQNELAQAQGHADAEARSQAWGKRVVIRGVVASCTAGSVAGASAVAGLGITTAVLGTSVTVVGGALACTGVGLAITVIVGGAFLAYKTRQIALAEKEQKRLERENERTAREKEKQEAQGNEIQIMFQKAFSGLQRLTRLSDELKNTYSAQMDLVTLLQVNKARFNS